MNNEFLERELSWCTEVVVSRVKLYFNQECKYANVDEIKEPALDDDTNAYCRFVRKHALSREERLTVIMACVPYLKPELMDCFQVKNNNTVFLLYYHGGFTNRLYIKGTSSGKEKVFHIFVELV